MEQWRKYLKEVEQDSAHLIKLGDQLHLYRGNPDNSLSLIRAKKRLRIENNPDRNEPLNAFWTSTAQSRDNAWSSEWSDFVKDEYTKGGFDTRNGLLLKVNPTARIFNLIDDNAYKFLLETYGKGFKKNYLNWEEIAKHYDGVRTDGNIPGFIKSLDVESTAFFTTDKFTLVRSKVNGKFANPKTAVADLIKDEYEKLYNGLNLNRNPNWYDYSDTKFEEKKQEVDTAMVACIKSLRDGGEKQCGRWQMLEDDFVKLNNMLNGKFDKDDQATIKSNMYLVPIA
jgi:hypothetical protein